MATSLAAAIRKRMGLEAELFMGNGGILEVRADKQLIYTNKGEAAEQHPGDEAIVDRLVGMRPDSVDAGEAETATTDRAAKNTPTPEDEASAPAEQTSTPEVDTSAPSCSIDLSLDAPPKQEMSSATEFSTFACGCAPEPGPHGCQCSSP